MMQLLFVLLSALPNWAQSIAQPTDPLHPGSPTYEFTVLREKFRASGRDIDVFIPQEAKARGIKVPVVVFGHGQAIDVAGYEKSFKHLAQKGVAVIHPTYDSGFFDRDWRRMASDFNNLTTAALNKYADVLDLNSVVYSGHSKGGYIALMAAGAPGRPRIGSVLVFAPAGFDAEYLKNVDTTIPVTLVWGDADTVIGKDMMQDIFNRLTIPFKQLIVVKSYANLEANHFFPLTKSYFFGGSNAVTAYHYFGFWKWMIGAAWDLSRNEKITNSYLYGDQAASTGATDIAHEITRSWK